jgi:hypothetical protein
MDDFSDLFTLLVRSFLSSASIDTPEFNKLYEDQRRWYKQLRTGLAESKYEYYLLGRKEEFLLMNQLVERIEVPLYMTSLRSGSRPTSGGIEKRNWSTKSTSART